jgi:hypothetical protein
MAENFWEKDAVVSKKDEWWSQDKVAQAPAVPEEDRDSTIGSELVRGGKQLASSIRTGLGALVGPSEEAARAGVQRSEAIAQEAGEGASLEAVKRAYREKGLLSAAGEVIDQAPRALASQAAQLALMAGGAKAGAVAGTAVAPGIGTIVGGALGAGATLLPQLLGSNVERQASEQMARDEEVDINLLAAGAGAVGQTAIETAAPAFILGKRLVKGLLGITDDAALVTAKAKQDVVDAANRSLLAATGRGVVRGAAVEIPIEIASSVIERAQAGLDVTSPDALAEYGEVAYQSALVGGSIGGISGPIDTVLARQDVGEPTPEAVSAFEREREEFAREAGPGQKIQPGTKFDDLEADVETPKPAATIEQPIELPGGFTVTRRELSRQDVPDGFGIFPESGGKPLATVKTEQEAQQKLESLTQIRQEEQKRLSEESDKINNSIFAEQRKLEVMEATGQADTDQYVQAKAALDLKEREAAEKLTDINDRIAAYSTPLTFAPMGTRTDVQSEFIVNRGEEQVGVFPSFEAAQSTVEQLAPEEFKQADIAARTQAVEAVLKPAFAKFNLGDVGLNIVEAIKTDDGQSAGGSYARNLIQVALDEANPLQTMRHESMHALKELGFFTPQQWNALSERAEKQWVKEYLEDQTAEVEVDGKIQQMSRLDAYKRMGLTRQDIVEEAIADAFGAYDRGATPPPGMIAALYKKLKNFFTNFGQAMRGAGFESADDIFQRVERGELKPRKAPKKEAKPAEKKKDVSQTKKPEVPSKPAKKEKLSLAGVGVPLSTRSVMEQGTKFAQAELGLKTEKTKGATGANNVRDVGKILNQYTIDNFGRMKKGDLSQDDVNTLAQAVADEVGYQLRATAKTGTGLGWYSNNYPNALKKLGDRFPELRSNEHARSVFSALVAVTSNGEDVSTNIKNAIRYYQDLRDGKPLIAGGSRRATALENNLAEIQNLMDKHGENFAQELNKEITVADLNANLRSKGEEPSSDYLATTKVPAAAIYFGPKLGAFFSNLSGSEGYLTMDLWWTRSINRMRGLLVPQATESSINNFRELMDRPLATREEVIAAAVPFKQKYEDSGYMTELEFLTGSKEPQKKADHPKWLLKAKRKAGPAFQQLMLEHKLEKMGNTIYKNEYEMLEEAPFNASDRKFMYDVAKGAQNILKSEGVDLSLADIQAALWYYEKRLYAKLTGREADDIGYEEAIITQSSKGDRREGPSVVFAEQPDRRPESKRKGAIPDESGGLTAGKLSLKKGVVAEVAPNPDHVSAEKWREMTGKERLEATRSVANKVMSSVFSELGLRGYGYSFSTGKYEGEVNPNIIVEAPKDATEQELDELGRVLGYVLDQKAMVVFDEDNKTSGDQAGFVKVRIPEEMSQEQLDELRSHIAMVVPQADGDTLRDGELVYGNFSAYNDSVDTLTDKQYHKAIRDAIESFTYDGVIDVSAPETFHSSFIGPDTRNDYLKETRYGDSSRLQGEAGANVRGQGRSRLQAISENAIALRDRWIDSRGAARLGGRERGNAVDFGQPTAEYGTPRQGSVSATGIHFSKQPRPEIRSNFYGTGLRGLDGERLAERENADIRDRVYFYVDNGKGVTPESGVGGIPHVIKLNNLYDTSADPLQIIKNVRGESSADRASKWERDVKKAGFDGYLVKNQVASQDYAVLIGKHAVKTGKYSLKNVGFPSVKAVKEAVKDAGVPNSPEFKRFIAGNQWAEADGKPTMFYHATAREFFEFTPAGQSQAIFLAKTPEEAETFGSAAEDKLRREIYEKLLNKDQKLSFFQGVVDAQVKKGTITEKQGREFMRQVDRKAPKYGDFGDIEQEVYDALLDLSPTRMSIMPLWARAETPFEFENAEHVEQVMQWVANNTEYPQDFPEKWLAGMKGRISQGLWQAIEDKRVQQALRALGFDSFTVRENRNSPKNYAVYKPEQVKSVTGNLGEYGRETKDMRFSLKKVRYSDDRFDKLLSDSMYLNGGAEKTAKGYLGYVRPMDFVYATANDDTLKRLRTEQEPVDFNKMRSLGPIGLGMSRDQDGNWKITGHEGRHRMLALADEGYNEIPVFIEFKGGIQNADAIPTKSVKAQDPDSINSSLLIAELEPLSYDNRDKAREKFTRMDSKVKYSVPIIPKAIDERVDEVTPAQIKKNFGRRIVEAIAPKSASHFRAEAVNRYNRMSEYDKERAKEMGGIALLADQSAESAALLSDVYAGVAASAMGTDNRSGGIPVLRNGITTIDRSVKGLIASLSPLAVYGDPKVYQRYQFWAMVKRSKRLIAEGRETGITSTDIEFAKVLEQKYPEFVSVQKDLIAFNNGLVKYMIDTGVLSKERGAEYVKYADYVPFYRQMEGEKTLGPKLFSSISDVRPPKKLKGIEQGQDASEAPLADFLETMVRNTTSAIQAGAKNYAAQRTVDVVTKVKAPGMGATRLDKKSNAPDVFNVLENGEVVSYQTADELLLYAVQSLNATEIPGMNFFAMPANLLRNLVTRDPGFIIANLLRDSLSAYVTSGQKMTPIVDTVIGFGKALGNMSPTTRALLDAGVISGYDTGNIEESGRDLAEDLAKKAGKRTDSIIFRPFTSLWDGLEKATTASDAATRAVIYDRVLAETGNEAEAIFRSLEVMNFHRKGGNPLVRFLTAAIPFFNARLQGLDLFYRASTGNMNNKDAAAIQRKFLMRGSAMMALSVAYYLSVADDEEYKKQEQETRDNNWLFPALGIRIPIPFEVGVLFKVIPERITALLSGRDSAEDFGDSALRNFTSTFGFNPIPQTFKPFLEAYVDYNFFTGRPILSEGMKNVAPQFQVGPGTTYTAEFIADLAGASPMKVDHIIKGFTGTIGGYALDTIDAISGQFSDTPRATKRFEQMPVIKRFVSDPEARGSVTEFYKLKESVDTVVRTMNLLEKTGESEAYIEYLKENQGTLAFKDYIRDTERTMKELRAARVAIRSSSMSGDEKRDALLQINRTESAITAEIQRVKKAISSMQ